MAAGSPARLAEGIASRVSYCGPDMVVVETSLKAGSSVPPHVHESTQLTLVIRGALKLNVGGREAVLRDGEYAVIEPGVTHSATALEDTLALDINAPPTEDRLEMAARQGFDCRPQEP